MKKRIFLTGISITLLLVLSFLVSPLFIESIGLILTTFNTLKSGWKQGLIVAIGVSIILILVFPSLNYINLLMVVGGSLLNFLSVLIISKTVSYNKQRNEKLKETKKELEKKNQLLNSILNNAPINIWFVDREQNPILVNKSFRQNTGFGTDDISMTEKEFERCKRTDKEAFQKNEPQEFEEEITYKNGEKRILKTIKTRVYHDNKDIMGVLGIGIDITEQKKREEKIKHLSFHDQLTGLYNRRYFENEIKRLNESRILPISIVVIDMDGLKYINDKYGHKKGDEFLKKAANILKQTIRSEDILARIGGDEFSIILPGIKSRDCSQLCKRIKTKLKKYNQEKELIEPISFSLGYDVKTLLEEDLNNVFNKADQKMYKNKGRRRKKLK